jgi:uncharacterized membrane protein YdjX (TVP38/TMEM64 family)
LQNDYSLLTNHYSLKNNKPYAILLGFLAVFPTVLSGTIAYFLHSHETLLSSSSTFWFFLIATFTMAFAITPTTFIAIISGYFFSWWGLVGIVISYAFASIIGLKATRWLAEKGWYKADDEGKLQSLLNQLSHKPLLFIIFARLSPILPFAMTNAAMATLKIKWRDYLLGSIIGMLPRTFIFFWAGKNAGNIWNFVAHPSLGGLQKMVPVLLILVSTLGLFVIMKRKMNAITKTGNR